VSFFVGADFADLPFVTTDDWETATGRVFPPAATDIRSAKNRQRAEVPWADRTPTAFFRGNSTGLGADPSTNQRLHLAATSHTWARSKEYGAGNAVDGVPFLDAGVVGFSARDRKEQGKPMTFMKARHFAFGTAERVPMYAQMRFKYHIYMDGHCAAMRYASMMPLGAVIIKVASRTKADSMWFFPLLRPYDIHAAHPDPRGDHVPVRADLSDLGEVIQWLKTHDAEARAIVANSTALYGKLVGLEGQLDYLQLVCWEIARRFTSNAELAAGGAVIGDGSAAAGSTASAADSGGGTGSSVAAGGEASSGVDRAALLAAEAAGAATLVPAFGRCPAVFPAPAASSGGPGGASSTSAGPHPPGSHAADSTAAAGATASTGDWFGPDNEDYTTCLIGRSAAPRPQVPLHMANVECECPACGVKRTARAAAATASAAAAGPAASRAGGGTRVFSTAGAAASLGFSGGGGAASKHIAGPGAAPGSASAAATAPKPALQMNDKMRERLAAAAALAKQKEAERASAAAAAGARGRH